jgi:hypothetical protein
VADLGGRRHALFAALAVSCRFAWNGKTYGSLSQIAKAMTGWIEAGAGIAHFDEHIV